MHRYRTCWFWVQLALLVTWTMGAIDLAPEPDLVLQVLDVQVQEKEDRRTDLNGGAPVLICTDDDDVRVYLQSVSPSSPCGIGCFQLQPCGAPTDYCLYYLPSQGSLNYAAVSSYTLNIVCNDDAELPSQGSMTVTVVSNTPPNFVPVSPLREAITVNGITSIANSEIVDVATADVDDDSVTYDLRLNPASDYITIGRNSGVIRFNQNARLVCEDFIEAEVTITDNFHVAVGPKTYDITVNGNLKPTFNNLGGTIQVPENTGAGSTIFTLGHVDAYRTSTVVQMRSDSNAALELYELNGFNLRLRVSPDYERTDTRSLVLIFQAHDGFCFSDEYSLTVEITDVEEAPEYQPVAGRVVKFVYEGMVRVTTGQIAYDDDAGETLTHTLVSGGSGEFRVDPNSGEIFSPNEIDIDNNRQFLNYNLVIRVTDSTGLTDDQSVVIQVRDSNDQDPYFQQNSYTFAATLCSDLGDVLGTVTGADDDSAYQNNNIFYFGGSSGTTAVTSTGQVVLTTPMNDGDSSIGTATITDTGLYPGPRSGTPVPYTVTCCAPCPTTAAPGGGGGGTTAAPGGGGGGGGTTVAPTAATTLGSNTASGFDEYLPWLIPAGLLGLLWLALTCFFIYMFCCPCRNPCPRRPKPVQVKPLPPPPKPQPPPKMNWPPKPPTPRPAFKIDPAPPSPEPENNPYLFGFWKEKYTDQACVTQPNRKVKPISIEQLPNEGNPPTPPPELRLGPENETGPSFIPTNLNAPKDEPPPPTKAWEQPKKKRFCIIL